MTLGYHQPLPNVIYGTANPETSSNPVSRAALQEAAVQANQVIKEGIVTSGYVPPGLGYGAPALVWPTTPAGPGPMARIGWTVQNAGNTPAFPPYSTENIGTIPDWTSDPNALAAGSYDATPAPTMFPPNRLNRAPVGAGAGDFMEGTPMLPPNPNTPTYDVGAAEDLEW